MLMTWYPFNVVVAIVKKETGWVCVLLLHIYFSFFLFPPLLLLSYCTMDSVHFNLATHPVKDTIKLLTTLLEKITHNNDQLHPDKNSDAAQQQQKSRSYTCFHARSIPSITIHAYFTRILKYCPCANECLIAILVYFDRMTQPDPKLGLKPLHIDSYNIHRLIITGLMISSKLYSDVFFTNTRYAKVR